MSDELARRQAIQPESFHLQAPAGSGKTETLTQRFLRLLELVDNPEEVLAITFTRKAADEMRDRIIAALKKPSTEDFPSKSHEQLTYQLAQKVLARDSLLSWGILSNTHRLRVMTFDSFCFSIATTLPVTSGLGASIKVTESPHVLYEKAVLRLLRSIESNTPHQALIKNLMRHLDNDYSGAIKFLVDLLGKREYWLPPLLHSKEKNVRMAMKDALTKQAQPVIDRASQILKPLESIFFECVSFAASNLKNSEKKEPVKNLTNFSIFPPPHLQELEIWRNCCLFILNSSQQNILSKIDKRHGFPSDKDAMTVSMKKKMHDLLKTLQDTPDAELILSQLVKLPSLYSDHQWQLLDDLSGVLPLLAAHLTIVFAEEGQVDFSEIAQKALVALGFNSDQPTDLALKLDYRLRHILVDEFQDTNSTQINLLAQLTQGWSEQDGHTLFVVGDPMQSIYSFRHANVGGFLKTRHMGIGNIYLKPLTLTRNFRSLPHIVEWNNRHFQYAFPSEENEIEGAVTYTASQAERAKLETFVEVHAFDGPQVEARKSEARFVVEQISNIKRMYPQNDIAILVRSRSHLNDILPALRAADIEWQAIDIEPLSSRAVINDLILLTRALNDLSDRVAWLGLLRTPFVGFDKKTISNIASTQEFCTILSEIKIAKLSTSLQERLNNFIHIIEQGLLLIERKSLRDVVEGVWIKLGGPACVFSSIDLDNAHTYLDLLFELEQIHPLITPDILDAACEKLFAKKTTMTESPVKIMTIYAAKGLEFDTVILPGLDRRPNKDSDPLLLFEECSSDGYLLAVNTDESVEDKLLYRFIKNFRIQKQRLEATRVLYVACTRAKDRLLLTGRLAAENKPPPQDSLWSSIWSFIADDVVHHLCDSTNIDEDEVEDSMSDDDAMIVSMHTDELQRLPLNWRLPDLPVDDTLSRYRQPAYLDLNNHQIDFSNQFERKVGEIIHQILRQIAEEGLSYWNLQRLILEKQQWIRLIRFYGINNIDNALSFIQNHIELTLTDNQNIPWLFADYENAQNEWALQCFKNGEIVSSIIDRTFIDQGVRWIVDYKTATPKSNETLDDFLCSQVQQYSAQLKRYADLFKMQGETQIKTALYFTGLQKLHVLEIE